MLIYKIVPRAEWDKVADTWAGSADDQRDGFIHFSTYAQLSGTLARHYAGQNDLLLLAVEAENLGPALKWERAPKRGEDFPHLYAPLSKDRVLSIHPLNRGADGEFILPPV